MPYFSKFFEIEVRDDIVEEFRNPDGSIVDSLAGLHEIGARLAEEVDYDLGRFMELIIKKRENIKLPLKKHRNSEAR